MSCSSSAVAQLLTNQAVAHNAGEGGQPCQGLPTPRVFQAVVTGSGTVSGTFVIQGTLNGVDWVDLLTLTCASVASPSIISSTGASNAAVHQEPWKTIRARCTAITGTSAVGNVFVGF